MNRIRAKFQTEVKQLLPLLHETYRLIGIYQKNRRKESGEKLAAMLENAAEHLSFFKPYLQPKKRAYIDALNVPQLSLSDKIIAYDIAVGTLHIEFNTERAYHHQESDELRRILNQCRAFDVDTQPEKVNDHFPLKGIAASPGRISGKAAIIRKKSDYRRLADISIIIAEMTRPEMVVGLEKIVGIVTDKGGKLCHAAVVAREMNIPCVVGTGNATEIIRPKMRIIIDGNTGTVEKGDY